MTSLIMDSAQDMANASSTMSALWEDGNSSSTSMWDFGNTTLSMTSPITSTTPAPTTTPKPCNPWDVPVCDPVWKAIVALQSVGIWCAFALGIPGNMLVIIILSRMKPLNSSSVWLLTMSSSDLLHLIFRISWQVASLDSVLGIDKFYSDFVCKFFVTLFATFEYFSNTVLVCLTVERFIAVWFPLKMSVLCTKTKAAIASSCIFIIVLSCNLHTVETYRKHVYFSACVVKKKYRTFWREIYMAKILQSFYVTVPVLLVVLFNILIVIGLRRSSAIKKQISESQSKDKAKQQAQVNRMLAAASVWFVVTVTPNMVHSFIKEYAWFRLARTRESYLMLYGFQRVTDFTRFSNVVANFVLYVLAARKFRREFIRLVTCNKYPKSEKDSMKSTTKVTST